MENEYINCRLSLDQYCKFLTQPLRTNLTRGRARTPWSRAHITYPQCEQSSNSQFTDLLNSIIYLVVHKQSYDVSPHGSFHVFSLLIKNHLIHISNRLFLFAIQKIRERALLLFVELGFSRTKNRISHRLNFENTARISSSTAVIPSKFLRNLPKKSYVPRILGVEATYKSVLQFNMSILKCFLFN